MPKPTGYLDTCIVSGLAKKDLAPTQISALLRILEARKAGTIELVTSRVAKEEIDRIPATDRTLHTAIYSLLVDVPVAPTHLTATRILNGSMVSAAWREDPLFSQLRNLLPDSSDAEHVFHAAKSEVSFLITVDSRTMLKHQAAVETLCGVRLVTPTAFEEAVLVTV